MYTLINQYCQGIYKQVAEVAAHKLHDSEVAQLFGIATFAVVMIICPLLIIISKNAISSIRVTQAMNYYFIFDKYKAISKLDYIYQTQFTIDIIVPKINKVFALSVEKKSADMRIQKKKQEKLIMKMLPKEIVQRVLCGERTSESFEHATLYFSSVDGFHLVSENCS